MRNFFLKIMDKSGNTFTLDVSTPSNYTRVWEAVTVDFWSTPVIGKWKSLERGFLKYNFGKTRSKTSHSGDLTTRDLIFLSPDGTGVKAYDGEDSFGIQLFDYEDMFGVNDDGEGFVIQPWVVNITPGRIRWEKASFGDLAKLGTKS